MDRLVQVERERLAAGMRQAMEMLLEQVMDAVNAARDGRLIQDSERPVLELMRDFQAKACEKALQLRIDSTESSFSPSAGPGGPAPAQQGALGSLPADPAGEALGSRQRRGDDGPGDPGTDGWLAGMAEMACGINPLAPPHISANVLRALCSVRLQNLFA